MFSKILLAACFLFPSLLGAQDSTKKNTPSMGGGGLTIGYGHMDVASLQRFLPADMPKISNDQAVIGGTGHGVMGRLVIGGSGFGIIGSTVTNDSVRASTGGGVGTFDIGYLWCDCDKVKIFPMIGIGGGGFGLHVTKSRNLSAKGIAANPGQEIDVSKGGLLVDVSLNLHFVPAPVYNAESKSYGGFMTGLKIGYLYSMPSSDWRYTGGDISGGPNFGLNMFYVKLIIGGFGYSKD